MQFEHFKFLVDGLFCEDEAGNPATKYDDMRPEAMNALVLAYIGDAYFHLFIRNKLLAYEQNKVQVLHQFGAQIVSAVWQARAYQGIKSLLTEEEEAVFKRGRNAKSHVPKSASVAEYRISTGFEALFGYLYLKERFDRLYELAEKSFAVISRAMMEQAKKKKEKKYGESEHES